MRGALRTNGYLHLNVLKSGSKAPALRHRPVPGRQLGNWHGAELARTID